MDLEEARKRKQPHVDAVADEAQELLEGDQVGVDDNTS